MSKLIDLDIQSFGRVKTETGYIKASPIPSAADLEEFYKNIYFQERPTAGYEEKYPQADIDHKYMRARSIFHAVEKVTQKIGDKSELLEIGFGEGFTLAAAIEAGYEVLGVDFGVDGLERFHPELKEKTRIGNPYNIMKRLYQEKRQYSVCVMHGVLEHTHDPEEILELARDILTKDGILVVTVPNDFSLLQKEVMDRGLAPKEYWWAPPQHLQYFNTENFPKFAEKSGYQILDTYGDFPIEFFLFHPGSNYAKESKNGKPAHQARVDLELMMAEKGIDVYVDFCRALSKCGMGRTLTAIMSPNRD